MDNGEIMHLVYKQVNRYEQLRCFTPLDLGEIDRLNAFLLCDNFEQLSWVELPTEGPDSDAFDEEFIRNSPAPRQCIEEPRRVP